MVLLKVVIFSLTLIQILGASVQNPKDTAAKLKSDFDTLTSKTRKSLDSKLNKALNQMLIIYEHNINPYNPIVDTVNAFMDDIYTKQLKTYVSKVRDILNDAVKLVSGESKAFINKNVNDIYANITIGAAQVNKVLDDFDYNVSTTILNKFNSFLAKLRAANLGRDAIPISKLLAEIKVVSDNIFNSEEVLVVGDKQKSLTFVDNSIASLQLPTPKCEFLKCIAQVLGGLLSYLL